MTRIINNWENQEMDPSTMFTENIACMQYGAQCTRNSQIQNYHISFTFHLPSVLWRCWLGDRKGIRPVKNEWWGAGVVICLERGADLHMAQLMPLPLTVSCFSTIQIGFTFLIPAHLGSPGKKAIKWVCVCVSLSTTKTPKHKIKLSK